MLAWLAIAHALGQPGINQVGSGPHSHFKVLQLLSYIWQFYLPRLPFMSTFRGGPGISLYHIWIAELAGSFGWLDVSLPAWMYPAAATVAAVIAVGAVAMLCTLRGERRLTLLGFFGLALGGLLALLHVLAYRVIIAGQGGFLQGRYLLPAIALLGVTVAFVVARLPHRGSAVGAGVVVVGLLAVQVVALTTVLGAYYL